MAGCAPFWTAALLRQQLQPRALLCSYGCRAAGWSNGFVEHFGYNSDGRRAPAACAGRKQQHDYQLRRSGHWSVQPDGGRPLHPSFLHKKGYTTEASAPGLVELMKNIVNMGGRRRGRTRDVVPKEAVSVFCARYSQLDEPGKEEILLSLAREFTPTAENVTAAIDRYTASVSASHCPLGDNAGVIGPRRTVAAKDSVGGREHQISGFLSSQAERRDDNYEIDSSTPGQEHVQKDYHIRAYEKLREELRPTYEAMFRNIVAESDDGVRFVVDLRQDLLNLMQNKRETSDAVAAARPLLLALDGSLRSLLQAWFSVGFLELRRITYEDTGGALLERITRYEAVHPVRSLSDLKHRLGHGRRCFAFLHPCLPGEPLVFVYVALLSKTAARMDEIRSSGNGGTARSGVEGGKVQAKQNCREEEARCAVFYSISSTQRGLQGVQLGNFLIKRVVAQLRAELPQLETFATLSPMPSFREWLSKKAKHRAALIGGGQSELSGEPLLTIEEAAAILSQKSPPCTEAKKGSCDSKRVGRDEEGSHELEALAVLLADDGAMFGGQVDRTGGGVSRGAGSRHSADHALSEKKRAAEAALSRLAARYLVRETVRGRILDPVGNFHVSNGARLDRVNWMADTSSKGVGQSFGFMVNYLYDPLEIESNNRLYLSTGEVPASDEVRELAWSLKERTGIPEEKQGEQSPPAGFL